LKIHYNPKLKQYSRELRKNSTFSERVLWKYLRCGQLQGYRFLRQKPIDEFIVDFFCKRLKLIIEIDGITHLDKEKYDKSREDKLKKLGFHVFRIDGNYVLQNIMGTLELILQYIDKIEKGTSP
jgi:very-short-patch-repair endonuclease